MIAVAGATGRLGTQVVSRLAERGLAVRALTRDPARARPIAHLAAEVVVCDVRDRDQTWSAVQGAETVISAVHGFAGPGRVSPASVDRDGNANLIDAAVAAGAEVVLMSVVGAAPAHVMELFRAKSEAERHLQAAATGWTIVRATAFLELWAEITGKVVLGRGENLINFVSIRDVAATVERAVIDRDLRSRVLEVGGPQDLTLNELAALVAQGQGRAAKSRHVPTAVLRAMAPFTRQARAALAMNGVDLKFDAQAHRAYPEQPMTDPRTALGLPAFRPPEAGHAASQLVEERG